VISSRPFSSKLFSTSAAVPGVEARYTRMREAFNSSRALPPMPPVTTASTVWPASVAMGLQWPCSWASCRLSTMLVDLEPVSTTRKQGALPK